ncbi:MAG: [FeFe] hydrogenase H-cluster maturation GTPase HydF [bacterium]|nr:[FeFe] hydrogenase H-cluster maturation GTPase HydF [bacterium]
MTQTLSAPKGLRLHIGFFGRRNVGKSSLINALTRQQISIVSPQPGTTTDPVEKAMELLPLGPVLLIDTAGIDDDQEELGALRIERTEAVVNRCDIALLITEIGSWGPFEEKLAESFRRQQKPYIVVLNKSDLHLDEDGSVAVPAGVRTEASLVRLSAQDAEAGAALRRAIIAKAPAEFLEERPIVSDLLPVHGTAVLVVPIDKEAPKGRLILPQVQTIRDLLDAGCSAVVTQVEQLEQTLANLKNRPDLVITDSQAFKRVAEIVPDAVPLTSFSVLFSRYKGDWKTQLEGAHHLLSLRGEARILIAEACTHHPIAEDIGTVKIPRLLRAKLGERITIEHVQGRDFPQNLGDYDLVIHCGACTLNRRGMLHRLQICVEAGTAVTNYGLAIAALNGILERSVKPLLSRG